MNRRPPGPHAPVGPHGQPGHDPNAHLPVVHDPTGHGGAPNPPVHDPTGHGGSPNPPVHDPNVKPPIHDPNGHRPSLHDDTGHGDTSHNADGHQPPVHDPNAHGGSAHNPDGHQPPVHDPTGHGGAVNDPNGNNNNAGHNADAHPSLHDPDHVNNNNNNNAHNGPAPHGGGGQGGGPAPHGGGAGGGVAPTGGGGARRRGTGFSISDGNTNPNANNDAMLFNQNGLVYHAVNQIIPGFHEVLRGRTVYQPAHGRSEAEPWTIAINAEDFWNAGYRVIQGNGHNDLRQMGQGTFMLLFHYNGKLVPTFATLTGQLLPFATYQIGSTNFDVRTGQRPPSGLRFHFPWDWPLHDLQSNGQPVVPARAVAHHNWRPHIMVICWPAGDPPCGSLNRRPLPGASRYPPRSIEWTLLKYGTDTGPLHPMPLPGPSNYTPIDDDDDNYQVIDPTWKRGKRPLGGGDGDRGNLPLGDGGRRNEGGNAGNAAADPFGVNQ